jgi:hypothetical protein
MPCSLYLFLFLCILIIPIIYLLKLANLKLIALHHFDLRKKNDIDFKTFRLIFNATFLSYK